MKLTLSTKLTIFVLVLFALVIATCLLWTPVKVKYYESKYHSGNAKQITDGVSGLLSLGEKGESKLVQLACDEWKYASVPRKVMLVDVLVANGEKGIDILSWVFGEWPEARFLQENWTKYNEPDKDDPWRPYPLHNAAHDGYADSISLFLFKGADCNVKDIQGTTPLLYALGRSHEDIAALLIENGADVNAKDSGGWTALHEAADNGCLETIELLILKNAKVNSKDSKGRTPLHQATYRGNKNCAEVLIEKGADLEAKDKEGRTPLFDAVFFTYENIVALLIESGADLNVKDNNGCTPLDSLVRDDEIIFLLRSHGASTSAELESRAGESPAQGKVNRHPDTEPHTRGGDKPREAGRKGGTRP